MSSRRVFQLFLSLLTLSAHPVSAQQARVPQVLYETTGSLFSSLIASDGDLSAVCWVDSLQAAVFLSVSDGRGTAWSPPLRVDDTNNIKFKTVSEGGLVVFENRVFVSWKETNDGTFAHNLFLNVYEPSSGSWSGGSRVQDALPPGTASLDGPVLGVERVGGVDEVHFLFTSYSAGTFDPRVLRYVKTTDLGQTYAQLQNLTPPAVSAGSGLFDMVVQDSTVHLGWADSRSSSSISSTEVFYQRSDDGGAHFLPVEVPLDASGPSVGVVNSPPILAVSGDTVCATWREGELAGNSERMLHAVVSSDGGLSLGPDHVVGEYGPDAPIMGNHEVVIEPDDGSIILAWSDDRTGDTLMYSARTTDYGLSYESDVSFSPIRAGILKSSGTGRFEADDSLDLSWAWTQFGSFLGTDRFFASYSKDAGRSYEPPILLIDDFFGRTGIAANSLYQNYLMFWEENQSAFGAPPRRIVVSGYRPQTLLPKGWSTGSSTAGFEFSHFAQSPGELGIALLSGSTGSFQLPGGLDLGVTADALFLGLLPLLGPYFTTTLDSEGAGTTAPWTFGAPPGITFYAVGVSLGAAGILQITDTSEVVVP